MTFTKFVTDQFLLQYMFHGPVDLSQEGRSNLVLKTEQFFLMEWKSEIIVQILRNVSCFSVLTNIIREDGVNSLSATEMRPCFFLISFPRESVSCTYGFWLFPTWKVERGVNRVVDWKSLPISSFWKSLC